MSQGEADEAALRDAIAASLSGISSREVQQGATRLMEAYRSGRVPERVLLGSRADVLSYTAYRMPATAAAARAATRQLRASLPGWSPTRLLDLGAGTGAATWAIASTLPSLRSLTLLEQSPEAIALGRSIFQQLGTAPFRSAQWRRWQLPSRTRTDAEPLPSSDLCVASYVLGELSEQEAEHMVRLAADTANAVLLIEPGTPSGYERIIRARNVLLGQGFTVAAPCPHDEVCELLGHDWCHFAIRVPRSSAHRRAKGAELSYEDEKYSFVAAVRGVDPGRPPARVIRHPLYRKGMVSLDLCEADGVARRRTVTRRHGDQFREARRVSWGDGWFPAEPPPTEPPSGPADLRGSDGPAR